MAVVRIAYSILVSFSFSLSLVTVASAQCPPNNGAHAYWFASITIPGKCYGFVDANPNYFGYEHFVRTCRNAVPSGGDIGAILNGFENQEIASSMKRVGVENATIGFTNVSGEVYWLSATGFSNYTNGLHGYTFAALMLDDGRWLPAVDGGLKSRAIIRINPPPHEFEYVLCQYYPDSPDKWPRALASCPDGWMNSMTTPEKCVRVVGLGAFTEPVNMTYAEAMRNCSRQGGDVMGLDRAADAVEFAYRLIGASPYFTSYMRANESEPYRWANAHPSNYMPTVVVEGNGGSDGLCTAIVNSYETTTLIQTDCDSGNYVLCELYPPPTTPAPSTSPTPRSCPDGWSASLLNPNKCYWIYNNPGPCEFLWCGPDQASAEPLTLDSDLELKLLPSVIEIDNATSYWIGLVLYSEGDEWYWTGRHGGGPIDGWAPDQPDNELYPSHACGALHDGAYYSLAVQASHPLICQLFLTS